MSWHYKDPSTFPAIHARSLIQASASPNHWIQLYHATSHSDAVGKVSQSRWFRWCCQQPPLIFPHLFNLTQDFKFRSKVEPVSHLPGHTHIVWLRAQPSKLLSLSELNPHLSDIFDQ